MENKDYVSYELAKKLYELDFDWDCEMAYFDRPWNHEHKLVYAVDASNQAAAYDGTDIYSAPALWEAQKWLREKKWHVEIRINGTRRMFAVELWEMVANGRRIVLEHDDGHARLFDDYEAALSAGISAALEILGKEGQK